MLRYAKLESQFVLGLIDEVQVKNSFQKLLDFNKPKNFIHGDKDNTLVQMDKNYTKTMLSFFENGIADAERFSMFEFRTTLEFFKERNDEYKKKNDQIGK